MQNILNYFPDLTQKQNSQFTQLKDLYEEWNTKINVISRKDMNEFYQHHVLHSLGIAKIQKFLPNTSIMDVGTGGGFPGIPLAILFPETQFYLIDSIGKKIKVVTEIAKALGLENVTAEQIRVENVERQFDFIISRAVTQMPQFVKWIKGKVNKKSLHKRQNGILYLKGGDLTEELSVYTNVEIFNLSDYFKEDFFITKKVVYLPVK